MRFQSVIVLLLVAGCSYSANVPSRIVGGQLTTNENYPSIVQVEGYSSTLNVWGLSCTASILTNRYVLSAAHCFYGRTYLSSERRIRDGTSYQNSDGQVVYVLTAINHMAYGSNGYDADITVVEMRTPLVFTNVVQQTTIMAAGIVLPDNSPVTLAGWGTTESGGYSSYQLRDVTVYTINKDICRQRYGGGSTVVSDNMICTGILDVGGKNACLGDAGGPVYYDNIVAGVVSWSNGCADPYYPGVSTQVSSYTDWIVMAVFK